MKMSGMNSGVDMQKSGFNSKFLSEWLDLDAILYPVIIKLQQ